MPATIADSDEEEPRLPLTDACDPGASLPESERDPLILDPAEPPSSGPDLSRRRLTSWSLDGLDLRGASLWGAKARGVDLAGRDLSGADLRNVRGRGLRLDGANLCNADLSWADLRCAHLAGAVLDGATTTETELTGADLRGAVLTRCRNLDLACLRDALADGTTRWPAGFDPRAAGVYLTKGV